MPETQRTPKTYPVPPGAPVKRCQSCGDPIIWTLTETGAKMPINPADGVSHYATCPQAKQWSGKSRQTFAISPDDIRHAYFDRCPECTQWVTEVKGWRVNTDATEHKCKGKVQ